MAGTHTRSSRVPAGRPRRTGHPAGIGWWQPPRARRATPAEPGPRHRSELPTPARGARLDRRRLGRALGAATITALAVPMAAFTAGYLLFAVPEPGGAAAAPALLVSFADGSELGRLDPAAARAEPVALARVPTHVRAAVLAAEDRSFYRNPGVAAGGLARALGGLLGGLSGGLRDGGADDGATITEQYLRQTATTDAAPLWRRFRELVLAVKISQQRSKDEVLADYLNSADFGRGAVGVQAAARAYFGKDAADLDAAEGALLAGLIQAPARTDPAVSPDRALRRWNAVLDGMVAEGWLDRGVRAAAGFPVTVPPRPAADSVPADSRGHLVTAVTAELTALGIPERELTRGGLRVTTTLDPRRQRQALAAARDGLDRRAGGLRGAVVAIDPGTGGVLAYYGGDDGRGEDYARTPRRAGPTVAPIALLAERQGRPGSDPTPVEPAEPATSPAPVRVSAFELASAYATLAAGGVWRPPHLVASVQAADGRVLYRATAAGERRIDESAARAATRALQRRADRDGLELPGGHPVAAGAGAGDPAGSRPADGAWTAGFTPALATTVWMGADPDTPVAHRDAAAGRPELPGRAWRTFMTEALREQPADPADPAADPTDTPADPSTDVGPGGSRRPPASPTADATATSGGDPAPPTTASPPTSTTTHGPTRTPRSDPDPDETGPTGTTTTGPSRTPEPH